MVKIISQINTLKKSKSKIFILLILSFILGILISDKISYNENVYTLLILSIIILIIIFLLNYKNFVIKIIVFSIVILFGGIIYFGYFSFKNTPKHLPINENVSIIGIVDTEPDIRLTKSYLEIKVAKVFDKKNGNQDSDMVGSKILVSAPLYPIYQYGDELSIEGLLEKPKNYNDFDYEKYLSKSLIFSVISNPKNIEKIGYDKGSVIYKYIYKIKNVFISSIYKILPEPMSSLMNGILIGARQSIPSSLIDIFNIVGLTHIIAISGYNITIIVKSFDKITNHWPRIVSFSVGILGIVVFTILTGASASVVRASIISSLFIVATQIGRRGNILSSVVFAGFIMIVLNPYILKFDIGFQLSFLSVMGLIFLSPIIEKYFNKITPLIREPLSATISAQLLTLPIVILYFSRLSIIAPIANIFVLPFIPITMFAGFVAGIVGIFWLKLGQVLAIPVYFVLKYIIFVSEKLSIIPFSSINISMKNILFVITYYVLLIIYVRQVNKIINKKTAL